MNWDSRGTPKQWPSERNSVRVSKRGPMRAVLKWWESYVAAFRDRHIEDLFQRDLHDFVFWMTYFNNKKVSLHLG